MIITLSFNQPINVSVQPGDFAYFTGTSTSAGFNTSPIGSVTYIGNVTNVSSSGGTHFLAIDVVNNTLLPVGAGGTITINIPAGSFIMFSKHTQVNISGVLGYYAKVTMRNYSNGPIELYSLGSDVIENSK